MNSLFTIAALWIITLGCTYAETAPVTGNSQIHIEYKDGIPISAKGFPPYTEIKEPYSKKVFVVQPDGRLKAEADFPHIEGALILRGNRLLFVSADATEEYESTKTPGIKVIKFTQKTVVRDGAETNVSEMTIEIYDGIKLTLVEGAAVSVLKVVDGNYVQWKAQKK